MRASVAFALIALALGSAAPVRADVENHLVFTRQNGEAITFPANATTFVWCGDYEPGSAPTPTFHVLAYDTTRAERTYWRLHAIPADVTLEEPLVFPNPWTWPEPDSAGFFVLDRKNEASTMTEDSQGSIVFHKLDCTEGGAGIDFTVDARIGSEFGDGPWITVTGTFRATLTGSPFVPAQAATWGAVKATYR